MDNGACGPSVKYSYFSLTQILHIFGEGDMWNFSVNSKPDYAKYENIKGISIDRGVTSIGDYAFCNMYNLVSVNISETILYIGEGAFRVCTGLHSIILHDKVYFIGAEAFCKCDLLEFVALPLYLKTIGDMAFASCRCLVEVCFGLIIKYIGNDLFLFCESLQNIIVNKENPYFAHVNGVLFTKNLQTLLIYPCGRNDSYYIPNSVISIYPRAFYESKILSVTMGNNVLEIGEWVFSYCVLMNNIQLSDQIQSIPSYAFYNCHSLKSITLSCNVKSIGEYGFATCISLKNVTFLGIFQPSFGSSVFEFGHPKILVYVPYNYNSDTFCGIYVIRI